MITWLEWGFSAPLARAAVRVVGSASDWRPVATLVVRTQLAMGLVTAVGLWFAAPFIAAWLDEPRLLWMLRLFALDLPLFALAQAHQQILVALGHFRTRALLPLVRWTVRLSLIVVCVEAGLSSYGAVLAIVGTSLIEIMVARRFVKPSIFRRSNVPVRELFDYAVPLLLSGLCLRVFDRVDVLLLRFLGRSAAEVGMYGAAQNLTLATGLFALAFSPVLLSTVTQAMRDGDHAYARRIARDSLRCVLFLIPLAAVLAASSREIVTLLFGDQYPAQRAGLSVPHLRRPGQRRHFGWQRDPDRRGQAVVDAGDCGSPAHRRDRGAPVCDSAFWIVRRRGCDGALRHRRSAVDVCRHSPAVAGDTPGRIAAPERSVRRAGCRGGSQLVHPWSARGGQARSPLCGLRWPALRLRRAEALSGHPNQRDNR